MLGLDTRVAFVRAMVLMTIDAENAIEQLDAVRGQAYSLGFESFAKSLTDVPVLFRDAKILADGWRCGFDDAVADQAICEAESS